jgi:hypothetical protein
MFTTPHHRALDIGAVGDRSGVHLKWHYQKFKTTTDDRPPRD